MLSEKWCIPADQSLCRLRKTLPASTLKLFTSPLCGNGVPSKGLLFNRPFAHSTSVWEMCCRNGLLLDIVQKLPANMAEKVLISLRSVFYIEETSGLN